MLRLLNYLLMQDIATIKEPCPPLEDNARGMPALTENLCTGPACNACTEVCPTDAITVLPDLTSTGSAKVALDLGACIGCGLCFNVCPTGTIAETLTTQTATKSRSDLVLTNDSKLKQPKPQQAPSTTNTKLFGNSLHARVVSTGCSACDLEIGAAGNPIFDVERFGVHVVASPRHADALIVTGPVSKGMHSALLSCYEAMPKPKVVVAAGTCAISGGVHRGGYASANGVEGLLPVDVYIPGCPPHPWQIVHGILLAMGRQQECSAAVPTVRTHVANPNE